MLSAFGRVEGWGATILVDAAYAALLLTEPRRRRPLVVVFSDGEDRGSWLTPEQVLSTAKASDVVVHYVDVGGPADLYRTALAIDSSLQPAWLGLSQALQASGDYEGAMGALEHALSDEEPRRNVWALYHSGRARAFPNALADLRARLRPLP